MTRRVKRYEHDNQDRWLVSYADFVTLLFAFFVVMYSISSVNDEKYKTFGAALNAALGKEGDVSVQRDQRMLMMVDRQTAKLGEQQRKVQERLKGVHSNLSQVMAPLVGQHLVSISRTKRGVEVDISASTLFRTGEAALQPATLEVLRQVAEVLGKEELAIEVEGHTDDVPIATAQFPSNWELSSARASSVARLLIENGVSAARLTVVGMAANQPLVPNSSAENRARNRRVTIMIVSPDIERNSVKSE